MGRFREDLAGVGSAASCRAVQDLSRCAAFKTPELMGNLVAQITHFSSYYIRIRSQAGDFPDLKIPINRDFDWEISLLSLGNPGGLADFPETRNPPFLYDLSRFLTDWRIRGGGFL